MRAMNPKSVSTNLAPGAIGPYSQAIRAGDLIFCSGQISLDPVTGEMVGGDDVGLQTRRVMDNLQAVLAAAGSDLSRVVKATIFLADLNDFGEVNDVYGSYFSAGAPPPARACVQVAALPRGAKVEIEATAIAG